MKLNARQVDAAKPKDKPYKLADGGGLYLFVLTSGGKTWRANYKSQGKYKTRTYGLWPDVSLADARKAHFRIAPERVQRQFHHFEQVEHGDVVQAVGFSRNRDFNAADDRVITRVGQRGAAIH